MPFIHEDFLLSTKAARRLYHKYAEAEPIFDYHCHIPPRDIATNRQFKDLFEICLEGDHYNGGRCVPMASRKNSAPATPRRWKNSKPGPARFRTRSATRCIIGRTWS